MQGRVRYVVKGYIEDRKFSDLNGTAKGNRTPVSGVRGRRPEPLDDGGIKGWFGWGGRT